MKLATILLAALVAVAAAPGVAAPSPPAAAAPVDPAKQVLAARVAAALWPDGTYGRMFDSMAGGGDGLGDMFLDMRPADMMVLMAQTMAEEGKAAPDFEGKARSAFPDPARNHDCRGPAFRGADADHHERGR